MISGQLFPLYGRSQPQQSVGIEQHQQTLQYVLLFVFLFSHWQRGVKDTMILRRNYNWHSCTRAARKADGGTFLIFQLAGIMDHKIQRYKAPESSLRVFVYVRKAHKPYT